MNKLGEKGNCGEHQTNRKYNKMQRNGREDKKCEAMRDLNRNSVKKRTKTTEAK